MVDLEKVVRILQELRDNWEAERIKCSPEVFTSTDCELQGRVYALTIAIHSLVERLKEEKIPIIEEVDKNDVEGEKESKETVQTAQDRTA